MKDLWPSASRFWHLIKPGLKRSKTQILTLSDPKIRGQEPKTLSKRAHNPLLKKAGLTKPAAAHPSGGPVSSVRHKICARRWHDICAMPSCVPGDCRDDREAKMARRRRRDLQPSDIEGLEYFDALAPLLARLKDIGTERDSAGNRQLFFD